MKGAATLLGEMKRHFDLKPGETTPDKRVSLLVARCLGTCGLAPAVVFDGAVAGKVEPEAMIERIERWLNHEPG
ncbi:MAG: hypothetical protein CUN53_09870 [Phototrophicales bacterium]|nr:MAG: hypothetical protein CUN53_09870 [Phototrophicales bacterium]